MNNPPFKFLSVVLSIQQILHYLPNSYHMRSDFLPHFTCVSKRSSRAWTHCCEIFHPCCFQVKLGVLVFILMHILTYSPHECIRMRIRIQVTIFVSFFYNFCFYSAATVREQHRTCSEEAAPCILSVMLTPSPPLAPCSRPAN
mgnify:FL=1